MTTTTQRTPAAALLAALALALILAGCGAPQIGGDRETFKAVEGLFTAVSLRDAKQVEAAEARLKALRDSGKLPEAAAGRLEAIGAEARAGGWDAARDQLRDFMSGQRR
ncbi:MAG: hypothetical protein K2X91_08115 [Thermoleophilia bacterium]|nr:hypothetical protein [Thermoleophilia bacterium]